MVVAVAAQLLDPAWRSSTALAGLICTVDSSDGVWRIDVVSGVERNEVGDGVGMMECWGKCLLRVHPTLGFDQLGRRGL
jgi:hypothetical protein